MADPRIPVPLSVRFWPKVDRSGGHMACWPWIACRDRKGYGALTQAGRTTLKAHRVSWEMTNGPIAPGRCVLHRCDNPPCVNPAHLFLGTVRDNNADMAAKGRTAAGDRHSSRLHPERIASGARHGSRSHPESVRRGESVHFAKLARAQVVAIVSLWGDGMTLEGIAPRFGVTAAAVHSIVSGRTWRAVAVELLPAALARRGVTILTEGDVKGIRDALIGGASMRALASQYEIDRGTIKRIRRGARADQLRGTRFRPAG